ncbi:hypothetical protein Gpo141_00009706 [Globisporangium polare]
MKIATTTALCFLAALAAVEGKTINLRVNVDHGRVSVAEVKGVDVSEITDTVQNHATTIDHKSVVTKLTKAEFVPSTKLHKTAAASDAADELDSCESVEIQPWVNDLKFACAWGSEEYGNALIFKLANGTYYTNAECDDDDDKTGLDKVFAKAMNGAYLTNDEAKEYNFKCYSQEHGTYVAKDHPEYESEFEYVVDQFADLWDDEEADEESED